MPRFYCPRLHQAHLSDEVMLDSEESHHALRVLRLGVGADVELFDGQGAVARGVVVRAEGRPAEVAVTIEQVQQVAAPRPWLELAVPVPKGPLADTMVNQLSQLGVDRLTPLRTHRSVVEPREAKLSRFSKLAITSAKQCGRSHVMAVSETSSMEVVFEQEHDVRLVATPGAAGIQGLAFDLHRAERVLVLIGPEGGLTEEEQRYARDSGCRPWSIGPHVMRIETAALAAATLVKYLARK